MKEVIDRVPTRPNRIKLTSESDGSINYYAWERADEPITDGTPINKDLFDSIGADITSLQQTTQKNTSDIATNKANIATNTSNIATNTSNIANLNNATRINLLKPTLQTQTVNGVTCHNNGDGTYTLNGTAISTSYLDVLYIELKKGNYRLLGCAKGGTNSTYCLFIYANSSVGLSQDIIDIGNGASFTLTNDGKIRVGIKYGNGYTFDNVVFKPMITPNLNATYDDFVSYEDSLATNKVMSTRVNLLRSTLQTQTINNVICTNNGDGTYTLNGTASANAMFIFYSKTKNNFIGKKLLGCPYIKQGRSGPQLYISLWKQDDSWLKSIIDDGDGVIIDDGYYIEISIFIPSGYTCNNLLFKPMLTTNLNATYDDFVSCLGTSWTQDTTNGYYTQTIACNGITSKDNPPIDVVLSGTLAEMQAQQEEWGKILKIETSTDALTFYASEATTVSLSVLVKGV